MLKLSTVLVICPIVQKSINRLARTLKPWTTTAVEGKRQFASVVQFKVLQKLQKAGFFATCCELLNGNG